jgi:hypothetical protein
MNCASDRRSEGDTRLRLADRNADTPRLREEDVTAPVHLFGKTSGCCRVPSASYAPPMVTSRAITRRSNAYLAKAFGDCALHAQCAQVRADSASTGHKLSRPPRGRSGQSQRPHPPRRGRRQRNRRPTLIGLGGDDQDERHGADCHEKDQLDEAHQRPPPTWSRIGYLSFSDRGFPPRSAALPSSSARACRQ